MSLILDKLDQIVSSWIYLDHIGSNLTKFDQISSKRIKLDQIGFDLDNHGLDNHDPTTMVLSSHVLD